MSQDQDVHLQGLIKSVQQKIQQAYAALDTVPDEHVAEVEQCETNLASQLNSLKDEYSEMSQAPEAAAFEDLDRQAGDLLSGAQALAAAHEQLINTVNQLVQTPAPSPATQYEVPEIQVPERFANKQGGHSKIRVGRHEPENKGVFDMLKDAFKSGRAQAKPKTTPAGSDKPVRRMP